jgi:hypothetical protein
MAVAADNGLTPRPGRIDPDELWALLRWMFAPYLTPTFRFDAAWWAEGRAFSRPSAANARHIGIT